MCKLMKDTPNRLTLLLEESQALHYSETRFLTGISVEDNVAPIYHDLYEGKILRTLKFLAWVDIKKAFVSVPNTTV